MTSEMESGMVRAYDQCYEGIDLAGNGVTVTERTREDGQMILEVRRRGVLIGWCVYAGKDASRRMILAILNK